MPLSPGGNYVSNPAQGAKQDAMKAPQVAAPAMDATQDQQPMSVTITQDPGTGQYVCDSGDGNPQPAQSLDDALSMAKSTFEPDADDMGGAPDMDQDDSAPGMM